MYRKTSVGADSPALSNCQSLQDGVEASAQTGPHDPSRLVSRQASSKVAGSGWSWGRAPSPLRSLVRHAIADRRTSYLAHQSAPLHNQLQPLHSPASSASCAYLMLLLPRLDVYVARGRLDFLTGGVATVNQ